MSPGLLGGILGATTSLNGVPPAILLARDRLAPRAFQADLAVYFIASNAVALTLLALRRQFATAAFVPLVIWLPIALLGNLAGTAIGTRLPVAQFRVLTYTVIFLAGLVTTLDGIGPGATLTILGPCRDRLPGPRRPGPPGPNPSRP